MITRAGPSSHSKQGGRIKPERKLDPKTPVSSSEHDPNSSGGLLDYEGLPLSLYYAAARKGVMGEAPGSGRQGGAARAVQPSGPGLFYSDQQGQHPEVSLVTGARRAKW